MQTRAQLWIVVAAIVALTLGAILSRVIEPGVRVEKVMLTPNTPALRIFPATPGPHPIALLAHGATGSKDSDRHRFFRSSGSYRGPFSPSAQSRA
jgi:hypothetical protein